jgi:hypothetical protein
MRIQTQVDTGRGGGAGRIGARFPMRRVACLGLALASGLAVMASEAAAAGATVSRPQLPFRCFARVDVRHVVFGPESFFVPNTVQGPTSFRGSGGDRR